MENENQNNRKKAKKGSVWRIIYPYLTIIGASILVSTVAGVVFVMQLISEKGVDYVAGMYESTESMNEMITLMTVYITENNNILEIFLTAIAIPVLLLYMRMDRRRLYREGEYVTYAQPAPVTYLVTVALGACAAVTFNNLLNLSGLTELFIEDLEAVDAAVYSGGILLEVIAVVILAPIAEELTFRGLIYRRMREVLPVIPSMLLSSLLFGYFHGNLIQGIYAFGIGMLCAFVIERYKNIWACILLHMGANLISVILSETSILEGITTDTGAIIYIAVFALGTVIALWYVHDKMYPEVLIPAGKDAQESDETAGDEGSRSE